MTYESHIKDVMIRYLSFAPIIPRKVKLQLKNVLNYELCRVIDVPWHTL